MSLRIIVDMNLSPDWVAFFQQEGWFAAHWSALGHHNATDQEIMAQALARDCLVLTHDLDFGTTLALTRALGPSVVQLRGQMFCRRRLIDSLSRQCDSTSQNCFAAQSS